MDNFNETLKTTHDWAMSRIQALCETGELHSVEDGCAIHDEFAEWFYSEKEDLDIFSLAYIGEDSEYA